MQKTNKICKRCEKNKGTVSPSFGRYVTVCSKCYREMSKELSDSMKEPYPKGEKPYTPNL